MPTKRAPARKKPARKPATKPTAEKKPAQQASHELRLTRDELVHIRDLFGVLLPPNGEVSVSQFLAAITGNKELEHDLFQKVEDLCDAAGVPTGDQAPDYVVMPIAPPPMGVFQAQVEETPDENEEKKD